MKYLGIYKILFIYYITMSKSIYDSAEEFDASNIPTNSELIKLKGNFFERFLKKQERYNKEKNLGRPLTEKEDEEEELKELKRIRNSGKGSTSVRRQTGRTSKLSQKQGGRRSSTKRSSTKRSSKRHNKKGKTHRRRK